jgi:ribonuclease HI
MLFTRSYIQGLLINSRASSSIVQKIIEIYTDGSCYNNKSSSVNDKSSAVNDKSSAVNDKSLTVGGYAVYFPGAEHPTVCESISGKSVTSSRCELIAVKTALTIYNDHLHGKPCTIYTDSIFVIDALYRFSPVWRKNGWKKTDGTPVKNQDLLVPICDIFDANRKYVSIKHVKAHTLNQDRHSLNNGVADVLAKNGAYPCELILDTLKKCGNAKR